MTSSGNGNRLYNFGIVVNNTQHRIGTTQVQSNYLGFLVHV
jgi:hypothetical protein